MSASVMCCSMRWPMFLAYRSNVSAFTVVMIWKISSTLGVREIAASRSHMPFISMMTRSGWCLRTNARSVTSLYSSSSSMHSSTVWYFLRNAGSNSSMPSSHWMSSVFSSRVKPGSPSTLAMKEVLPLSRKPANI